MTKLIPSDGFVGVAVPDLAFYGVNYPHLSDPDQTIREQLQGYHQSGVRLVRIFTSHHKLTTAECVERVKLLLNQLSEQGIDAILCLEDSLTSTGTFIAGTERFHSAQHGHLHKSAFSSPAYRDTYLIHSAAIIEATHDHPATLFYELGNAFQLHASGSVTQADADAFMTFCATMSHELHAVAPILIGTGLRAVADVHPNPQNSSELEDFATQLYRHFNLVSAHHYKDATDSHLTAMMEQEIDLERRVAMKLNLQCYVGALAQTHTSTSRAEWFRVQIDEWSRQTHCLGVFLWAVNTLPASTLQSTDQYGVAHERDQDYAEIMKITADFTTKRNPGLSRLFVRPVRTLPKR
jgi:hypothetical protein